MCQWQSRRLSCQSNDEVADDPSHQLHFLVSGGSAEVRSNLLPGLGLANHGVVDVEHLATAAVDIEASAQLVLKDAVNLGGAAATPAPVAKRKTCEVSESSPVPALVFPSASSSPLAGAPATTATPATPATPNASVYSSPYGTGTIETDASATMATGKRHKGAEVEHHKEDGECSQ
jgi:hypothetical protein